MYDETKETRECLSNIPCGSTGNDRKFRWNGKCASKLVVRELSGTVYYYSGLQVTDMQA